MTIRYKQWGALAALALVSLPAMAHPGHDHGTGFLAGFIHPFTGIDHLLAMLGVGIWGAQQRRGLEQPLTFLAMMLIGALAGMAGLGLPGLEMGIAATVALTGLAIALALSMPNWLAMGLVGVFALAHGNAHGQELSAVPATFGFMLASAILLLSGRVIGQMLAERVVRVAGAAITAVGLSLVVMGMN